jgi:hypothetical protein
MTYRVVIQPTAESELDAAYRRISDQAPAAAARWFNGIIEAMNTLQAHPFRCRLALKMSIFPRKSANCSTVEGVTDTAFCSPLPKMLCMCCTSDMGRNATYMRRRAAALFGICNNINSLNNVIIYLM